ncbi:MAG TPA: methyltransferase, partial [Gemmatimonadaceae bacterium]
MSVLATLGVTHLVELSPHPVLLGMGAECLPGDERMWLPSLREGQTEWSVILESLQALYAAGVNVDWSAFDAGHTRRRVPLPTYPFRRWRHWIDIEEAQSARSLPVAEPAAARWARLNDALRQSAGRGPLDLDLASYPAKWDCLARITTAHAARTLRDAGVFVRPTERHTVDEVLAAAGIATEYRHLVHRWLERLVDAGALRRDGEQYVADVALAEPPIDALWSDAERLFATGDGVLAYVRHCGTLVGDVVRRRESPLETLFPGGSFDLAAELYERSAMMRYVNALAASALSALANVGRTLRVLEIGAGTGGTTASLLPALPPDGVRYRFTDVSDAFLDRARERFAPYSFVEYGRFDADQTLAAQGYADTQFDVIVAANAIHATRDLRAALDRLRTLLAPGGVLLLVESTRHFDWFDMTTGLIEGWQHFADDLRGDNPLLSPRAWVTALRAAGFADAAAWPETGSPAEVLGQHVIVARAPGEATVSVAPAIVSTQRAPASSDTPKAANA